MAEKAIRITGHALCREGWPHTPGGAEMPTSGGTGRAHCECGWIGPPESSNTRRRESYRQHKAAIQATKESAK